ncbi:hypothetical protein RND71_013834 [Anisodus tanguticus]|uniref:Uncharacterized protein n=1 Tax=Anisodus tanguticus TaxID=243964 RepID=A0AAE1S7Z5_9SOLA|nr:hypothetical protein RND71_013834 [Anisodus tanguticus]
MSHKHLLERKEAIGPEDLHKVGRIDPQQPSRATVLQGPRQTEFRQQRQREGTVPTGRKQPSATMTVASASVVGCLPSVGRVGPIVMGLSSLAVSDILVDSTSDPTCPTWHIRPTSTTGLHSTGPPPSTYAPTNIEATMTLNAPDENWYMDTGAISHMMASQGLNASTSGILRDDYSHAT